MNLGAGVWYCESPERSSSCAKWQIGSITSIQKTPDRAGLSCVAIAMSSSRATVHLKCRMTDVHEDRHAQLKLANRSDLDLASDLIQLPHLNLPSVCHTLSRRYGTHQIYTYVGQILIAMNPFEIIPGLYGASQIQRYIQACGALEDLPPHVYAIADQAYRSLFTRSSPSNFLDEPPRAQSILVSGESGAGKTESMGHVMNYLAEIAQVQSHARAQEVIHQVLHSNPILESFGNARTIRNHNSSRFGKFIQMRFRRNKGQLEGMTIQTLLLEKVRLVRHAPEERNFHIFYQMLAGASAQDREAWQIQPLETYAYLRQKQNSRVKTLAKERAEDRAQFKRLQQALDVMAISTSDQHQLFLALSALLTLGNVDFDESMIIQEQASSDVEGESGELLDERRSTTMEIGSTISDASSGDATKSGTMLGLSEVGLASALCTRKIKAMTEWITCPLRREAAVQSRDALAKFIYGQLFDYVVHCCNDVLMPKDDDNKDNVLLLDEAEPASIYLLDLFGFEDLRGNSLEQLCINYANETLQAHFNDTMVHAETRLYREEGLDWPELVVWSDAPSLARKALLDAKPSGIFHLLNEECIMPRGNDAHLARKLATVHQARTHFHASPLHQANHQFVLHHYAGRVMYDTTSWCDKNKDVLRPELRALLEHSTNAFLRKVVARNHQPACEGQESKNLKQIDQPVSTQFQTQLKTLMDTLGRSSCHYIRCLKSNAEHTPGNFDPVLVQAQCHSGGIVEAIQVSQSGYPIRMSHQETLRRYGRLVVHQARTTTGRSLSVLVKALEELLCPSSKSKARPRSSSSSKGIQVGRTQIFFRPHVAQALEAHLTELVYQHVTRVQAWSRAWICRRDQKRQTRACLVIQQRFREYLEARNFTTRVARSSIINPPEHHHHHHHHHLHSKTDDDPRGTVIHHRIMEQMSTENEASEERMDHEEPEILSFLDAEEDYSRDSSLYPARTSYRLSYRTSLSSRTTTEQLEDETPLTKPQRVNEEPHMEPGDSILHMAANSGQSLESLLLGQDQRHHRQSCDVMNKLGRTPLHVVACSEVGTQNLNLENIALLLDLKANAAQADYEGNTPLHLATDPKVIRLLLEACPAILDRQNKSGRTPLMLASIAGNLSCVKELLEHGADVSLVDSRHGQTALHLATKHCHVSILEHLCQRNYLLRKHSTISQTTLTHLSVLDMPDIHGNTALHFAATRELAVAKPCIEVLMKYGADVHVVNTHRQTPLGIHVMVTKEHETSTCELLLEYGSDPNAEYDVTKASSSCGSQSHVTTILHIAIQRRLISMAMLLIAEGAEVNMPDADGRFVTEVVSRGLCSKLLEGITRPPKWTPDHVRHECMVCQESFHRVGRRRHHCRHCGRLVCHKCSHKRVEKWKFPRLFPGRLGPSGQRVMTKERVCLTCELVFVNRQDRQRKAARFQSQWLGQAPATA